MNKIIYDKNIVWMNPYIFILKEQLNNRAVVIAFERYDFTDYVNNKIDKMFGQDFEVKLGKIGENISTDFIEYTREEIDKFPYKARVWH
ncbi:MAG: hypothetical protein ACYDBX_04040 [Patescibacteria group bacterium]